jgi:hypothetical protein
MTTRYTRIRMLTKFNILINRNNAMIISSTFYFKNVRGALEQGAKENDGC